MAAAFVVAGKRVVAGAAVGKAVGSFAYLVAAVLEQLGTDAQEIPKLAVDTEEVADMEDTVEDEHLAAGTDKAGLGIDLAFAGDTDMVAVDKDTVVDIGVVCQDFHMVRLIPYSWSVYCRSVFPNLGDYRAFASHHGPVCPYPYALFLLPCGEEYGDHRRLLCSIR